MLNQVKEGVEKLPCRDQREPFKLSLTTGAFDRIMELGRVEYTRLSISGYGICDRFFGSLTKPPGVGGVRQCC